MDNHGKIKKIYKEWKKSEKEKAMLNFMNYSFVES